MRRAARDRLFNPYSYFGLFANANDSVAVYSLVPASDEPSILQILAYLGTHRRNTSEADKTIKPRELNRAAPVVREIHFLRTCANCESCVSNNIAGASSPYLLSVLFIIKLNVANETSH